MSYDNDRKVELLMLALDDLRSDKLVPFSFAIVAGSILSPQKATEADFEWARKKIEELELDTEGAK